MFLWYTVQLHGQSTHIRVIRAISMDTMHSYLQKRNICYQSKDVQIDGSPR